MHTRGGSASLRRLLCVLILAVAIGACGQAAEQPVVRLKELASLPPRDASVLDDIPLRVAIASVISPRGTIESYTPLLAFLANRLGRRVELVQRQSYAETSSLVARSVVDLAIVCTGPYVEGRRDKLMELLVVPQVGGESVYYSYLIVPRSSPARTWADLRGKTFAFTDPLSNSGHLSPVYRLWQMGERPETFFARQIYTYSHDNSIQAVADALVDGAAVDSLVYEFFQERSPQMLQHVRIIEVAGPFGIPPVVVPTALNVEMKSRLRDILLRMHEDPEGRRALAELRIDRFVEPEESAYDSVGQMIDAVGRR